MTLDWNQHSELMDYFPSEGYNFLLVRDVDNKSAPHLGFFLRQLEEQTEKPVTVRSYLFEQWEGSPTPGL